MFTSNLKKRICPTFILCYANTTQILRNRKHIQKVYFENPERLDQELEMISLLESSSEDISDGNNFGSGEEQRNMSNKLGSIDRKNEIMVTIHVLMMYKQKMYCGGQRVLYLILVCSDIQFVQ